jgi:hypothetical protein
MSRGLRQVQAEAGEALANHIGLPPLVPPPPRASLRELLDDLRQLGDEFEEVTIDLEGSRLIAATSPIELEGVALGPFAIELHLGRLADRRDASCFDCVALKPNPASTNGSVTHPHVQDQQLCAGEASAPIAAALGQGRVLDAFCLVRSVLQTYNPASPYVALDEWDGVTCGDCGYTSSRENSSWCEHCDRECCDECMSACDACDGSCCRGCLERDEQSDTDLCPACRTECSECGRVVASDDVERATGLCPQCRQQQEDPEEDPEQEEQAHAEPDSSNRGESDPATRPGPASGATAAA